MKTPYQLSVLLLLFGVFTFLPVEASGSKTDPENWYRANYFCKKNGLASKCLRWLLIYQCVQHQGVTSLSRCTTEARNTVTKLDFLDLKANSNPDPNIVAFSSEFKELILQAATLDYLKTLNVKLDEGYRFKNSFNLWNFTFQYVHQNKLKALQLLAVLFQDNISRNVMSLAESFYKKPFENETLKNLDEALNFIDYVSIQKNPQEYKWLELYPNIAENELNKTLNQSLYHFYVPAYLAATTSALMAFDFNASYKLSKFAGWPLKMPESIDLSAHEYSMKDIFAGLQGATFGSKNQISSLSYPFFKYRIALLPSSTMKKAARTLIN